MNNEYSPDPLEQFRAWHEEGGTDAVALATATRTARRRCAWCCSRRRTSSGFLFFTSYESRKGARARREPPRGDALPLARAARCGSRARSSASRPRESDTYWADAARGSRRSPRRSRGRARPSSRARSWSARFAEFEREIPERSRGRRTGAASASIPESYEFWEHEKTACTTASATAATAGAGRSNDCSRDYGFGVILGHLDLDAFFAAVEELEKPELRSKPLIVGGDPRGRGVVATANYEARKFGIGSAMSCAEALRRCPHAVFVRPRHSVYREYSALGLERGARGRADGRAHRARRGLPRTGRGRGRRSARRAPSPRRFRPPSAARRA